MSLIDRYVHAVTRSMHPDTRKDVARELRATIEDELDAKGGHTKKNITEVLTELGDPAILAHQYKGRKNYLIGPDLYYLFTRILRLVLVIVLPILFVVNVITGFGNDMTNAIQLAGYALGHTIAGAITVTFWVTATFFILERTGVTSRDLKEDIEPWTPEKLPKETGNYQIPASTSITNIVWFTLLLVAPFVAPRLVMAHVDGQQIPFFAPELWAAWTPIIIAISLVGIAHSIGTLIAKKWTALLAIGNVLLALAASAALLSILLTTPVVNETFAQLIAKHTDDVSLSQIQNWISWSVAISFIVSIGVHMYEAGRSVWLYTKSR